MGDKAIKQLARMLAGNDVTAYRAYKRELTMMDYDATVSMQFDTIDPVEYGHIAPSVYDWELEDWDDMER